MFDDIREYLCGHGRIITYYTGKNSRIIKGISEGCFVDGFLIGYGRRFLINTYDQSFGSPSVVTDIQVGFWKLLEDSKGQVIGDIVPDGKFIWLQTSSDSENPLFKVPLSLIRCKAEKGRIRIHYCKSKPIKSLKKNNDRMPLVKYSLFSSGPKIYFE